MKEVKKLKTFEDACKIEKLDPKKILPDFSCYPEEDRKALEAHAKLLVVVKAANRLDNNNKEWTPDWTDGKWKYEPWFVMNEGSSGFRYDVFDYWFTLSCVGSRLCFKSEDVCEYITNQFIDLYRDYFMK
ncbi:MAG: hypothetical protein J5I47_01885 [Vicingus serpentipes]|nr:hypothetical protein [Vicingus serpentipes]